MSLLRYARLPRPASTAAPPIPNSRPSCSPAVPPPPAAGGPVGTAGGALVCVGGGLLCDGGGLLCSDGGGLLCSDGGFDEECDAAASGGLADVCVGVAGWLVPGEPAGDVPAGLVPAVGWAGPLGLEGEHAETETTTVKVAQAAK